MRDARAIDRRLQQMLSLRVAATDMETVSAGVERLLEQAADDRASDSGQAFRHVLMTGVTVSYARPWTTSHGNAHLFPLDAKAPELLDEILPPERTRERALHDTIIKELRHKVYAHTDADAVLRPLLGDFDVVRNIVLTFGPGALNDHFLSLADDTMEHIGRMADAQRRRFWTVIKRLGDEVRAEHAVTGVALLDPAARCSGGCAREVGPDGRYYSTGLGFSAYCPECAQRDFH